MNYAPAKYYQAILYFIRPYQNVFVKLNYFPQQFPLEFVSYSAIYCQLLTGLM